jgi:hypothetical protein
LKQDSDNVKANHIYIERELESNTGGSRSWSENENLKEQQQRLESSSSEKRVRRKKKLTSSSQ